MSVLIRDNKDFLGYNWAEVDGSVGHSVGYHSVLSDHELATYQTVHDNVPGVTFFIWNDSGGSDIILSDCINKLYGTPEYNKEEETLLLDKYDELFNYKQEEAIPEIIWVTPISRIVLLKVPNWVDWRDYEVYAEPNI